MYSHPDPESERCMMLESLIVEQLGLQGTSHGRGSHEQSPCTATALSAKHGAAAQVTAKIIPQISLLFPIR
jgi:hypothetical protein